MVFGFSHPTQLRHHQFFTRSKANSTTPHRSAFNHMLMNASFSCNKQLKFARRFGSGARMPTCHLSKSCVHGANLIHNSRCALRSSPLSSSLPLKSKPGWHIWKIKYQLECGGGVCVCVRRGSVVVQQSAHVSASPLMCSKRWCHQHINSHISNNILPSSQCIGDESKTAMNLWSGGIARHDNDDNIGRPHSRTHERVNSALSHVWLCIVGSSACLDILCISFWSIRILWMCRSFAIKTIWPFQVSQGMTWRILSAFFSKSNYLLLLCLVCDRIVARRLFHLHTHYTLRCALSEQTQNENKINKQNKTINDKTRMHHEIRMNYLARTCYHRWNTAEFSVNVLPGAPPPKIHI